MSVLFHMSDLHLTGQGIDIPSYIFCREESQVEKDMGRIVTIVLPHLFSPLKSIFFFLSGLEMP